VQLYVNINANYNHLNVAMLIRSTRRISSTKCSTT